MRNSIVAILVCALTLLVNGCAFFDDSDDQTPSDPPPPVDIPPPPDASPEPQPGTFLVSWKFFQLNPDDLDARTEVEIPAQCPLNIGGRADVVRVVSQPIDGGDPLFDEYSCFLREEETAPVPPGTYDVWLEVVNDDVSPEVILARSPVKTEVSIELDEHIELEFDISIDSGVLGLTWSFVDELTDEVLSCSDVGAQSPDGGVSVLSTLVDSGGTGFDDIFTCEDGQGSTDLLPLGDYTVVTSLLDQSMGSIGESLPRNISLEFGGQFEDLGDFNFVIP